MATLVICGGDAENMVGRGNLSIMKRIKMKVMLENVSKNLNTTVTPEHTTSSVALAIH